MEDDVTAHRKTAQALRELIPSPPESGLLCHQLELLIDQVNERICLIVAVIGDQLPDFREIGFGAGLENNHRHGLPGLGGSTP